MKHTGTPIGKAQIKTDATGKVTITPAKKGFLASMKARKTKKTPKYKGGHK